MDPSEDQDSAPKRGSEQKTKVLSRQQLKAMREKLNVIRKAAEQAVTNVERALSGEQIQFSGPQTQFGKEIGPVDQMVADINANSMPEIGDLVEYDLVELHHGFPSGTYFVKFIGDELPLFGNYIIQEENLDKAPREGNDASAIDKPTLPLADKEADSAAPAKDIAEHVTIQWPDIDIIAKDIAEHVTIQWPT